MKYRDNSQRERKDVQLEERQILLRSASSILRERDLNMAKLQHIIFILKILQQFSLFRKQCFGGFGLFLSFHSCSLEFIAMDDQEYQEII